MRMTSTPAPYTDYPHINALLLELLGHTRAILGEKLIGLYLYGSLVTGDFDEAISDIDLLAALSGDLTPDEFQQLQTMHRKFAAAHPDWDDRIEVAYLSKAGLQTFRTETTPIAVISPGEPFNQKTADRAWLMNWWMVREMGVTIHGPPPTAIISPIATAEFIECVREHTRHWGEWVHEARSLPAQAYVILTLCRALYATQHEAQVSKLRAALWAQGRYPRWAALVQSALRWRTAGNDAPVSSEETFAETEKFVYFAMREVGVAQ